MKKLSNNVIQDSAFNAWARNKEFASEEAFTAALSAFRDQQRIIDGLRKVTEEVLSWIENPYAVQKSPQAMAETIRAELYAK
jgi:hypothetical protein